jgi:hypothetical protein
MPRLAVVPPPRKSGLRPERLELLIREGSTMLRVPSDREEKLLELLDALLDTDVTRLDGPTSWRLRAIQAVARRRVAEYDR